MHELLIYALNLSCSEVRDARTHEYVVLLATQHGGCIGAVKIKFRYNTVLK
jgi:hypothetical protein